VREESERISLTVNGTLYSTFNQIPFGTELMQRLMNVFSWHMRLPKEVLLGDRIDILAVKRYVYDEFIGYGKIETAIYRQKTRTLSAIFFQSKDKKYRGFFDEKGKSLEKEFAISPVYETFATSDQKWRLHPVRKIPMRHNGIDYRGTIGTEFFSIADGEVIEKRFDVNVGNMIRVLHKYGVHSEYFHADSLAENVTVGSRVKRGQLLGTIGRTGRLCTGPHLHMGLYTMHGEKKKFIELTSLRNTLKSAPDIGGTHAVEFMQHQKAMIGRLMPAEPSLAAAVQTAVIE
jgi:murein DD-endopeptidase MepM/ murein hydrolase activator NlpD